MASKAQKEILQQKHRLFHSFCSYPEADFNTRERGEKIVLILRAHPVTQLPWVFNFFIMLLLVLGVNLYLKFSFPEFFTPFRAFAINFLILSLLFSYVLINITTWFFNVGIITTRRILDLDYKPLTFRDFSGTKIENVEDISSVSAGPFSSIFRYGNVEVQTAGSEQNIEFIKVPYPDEVVKIINNLITKRKSAGA